MKNWMFSEGRLACALRHAENGTAGAAVCRQLAISGATFYLCWKRLPISA
jgi:hypothetical protein